jgi:hypothetical protein
MRTTVNLSVTLTIASTLLLPVYSHADALDKIGNNISNTANDTAAFASDSAITTGVKAAFL